MKTEYAVRRPVRNAYLVRERDRRRWREVLLVLFCVVPPAAALVSYTWIHLEVLETGYEIDAMERQLGALLEEERRLELDSSRLRSPSRIEPLARERLGLAPPTVDQMVFVREPLP